MIWKDGGNYGRLSRAIVSRDGSRAVCRVWTKRNAEHRSGGIDGSDTEPWPEGEANFRLILNAPKMLEALEAIAALDPAFWCEDREHGIVAVCDQCKATARAAIAAMKGNGDETKLV